MNDDLHDEVEEMFREESCKHRQEARKSWVMPPGYYDEKLDPGTHYYSGLIEFKKELVEIRRLKHPHRGKKKK